MAAALMTLSDIMFYLNSGRQFLLDKYGTFAPRAILNVETTPGNIACPESTTEEMSLHFNYFQHRRFLSERESKRALILFFLYFPIDQKG